MLQTYIDKFKLQVQWIDEGGFWGSQDENGTFNGVVGRVSKKFSEACMLAKEEYINPNRAGLLDVA